MAQVTRIVSGGVQNGPLLPNLSKPHKPTPPFTTPFLRSGPNVSSFSLKHERAVSNSVVSVRAPFRVSASVATKEKPSTAPEIVLRPIKEISGTITLPGSKSLSNRILLLAALSEGTTVVDNLLNNEDVHYMLGALSTLGLQLEEQSENKRVIVQGCGGQFPVGNGSGDEVQLFLGNAGTAMRPLTAAVTAAGGNASF